MCAQHIGSCALPVFDMVSVPTSPCKRRHQPVIAHTEDWEAHSMTTPGFRTHMRAAGIAWLALLMISAASLGSLPALVGVPDRESGTRAVARTSQAAAVNRGGA